MLKIQFDDKELLAKFEEIANNASKMAEDMEKELGNIALESAKKNVPVDTGALRDSIDLKKTADGVEIGSDLEYAAAVEYGTTRHAPQPYLKPASQEINKEAPRVLKAVLNKYD